ncbi:glyoxalase family protein [Penicillium lagena]|uniref:glyoxalase family protein n=1 Tax=Penicillium lagena TaxID=94218 RepID=UPI0025406241|nr:glyoxalase family protein [Penicillium lagena]KAJ5610865.1 glyoxalase family protein [Penicillium lagena]
MSKEDVTAVELLTKTGTIVLAIETNLHHNRLDRKTIRRLLREYSARAESDGRLINAARQDSDCANRGLFLAYAHMELITWLANKNYTVTSSSIQWYSWKQFQSKYRLPPFWTSSYTSDLQSQLDHIEKTAALVCADLEAHNVSLTILDNLWTFSDYRQDFDPGHCH